MNRIFGPGFLCLMVGGALLVAQQRSTAHPDQSVIPSHVADFSAPKILTNIAASPFMVNPIQCSSDGRAFVEMVPNGDVLHRALYSISSSGEVVAFNRASVPSLRDVQVISDYPGKSEVVSLVLARKDSANSALGGDKAEDDAQRLYFLVVQDSKGRFKRVAELKIRIKPVQVAST